MSLDQQQGTMTILKMEETAIVWTLLQSDLRPIQDVLTEFNSKFPRPRYFTVCSALSMLLQARALSSPLNARTRTSSSVLDFVCDSCEALVGGLLHSKRDLILNLGFCFEYGVFESSITLSLSILRLGLIELGFWF